MSSKYKNKIVHNFCKKYNINKKELLINDAYYFRYICFKYNFFMRHIKLPKISSNTHYNAVLIEFRIFPHIEFLIRNCILKLGEKWCYTIFCGNLNYEFMVTTCNQISPNINIIKLDIDNITPSQYSKLLTTPYFWNMINSEKILIYQEDSIMFHENIRPFLKYDYIGAPFPKHQNDTPNCVGNGGFSLRSKSAMIKILANISVKETIFNSSTITYMKNTNSDYPPEDVYFSKNMQEKGIGEVADYDTASLFSSETIFNTNSLGGHKFWISDKNWKSNLNNKFKYNSYVFNSDLNLYITHYKLNEEFNKTKQNKNAFDIDLYFCNYVNGLNMDNNIEIMNFIRNTAINGYVYHPKQIKNVFQNIKFYNFLDRIFVVHKLDIYEASYFVKKYLYDETFENLSNSIIKKIHYNLNKNIPLLLLVFIGNEERGRDLLDKIIGYKKIQNFNISFCFNVNADISEGFKNKIKNSFEFYSVYESKECGTDITPTMLMYNNISQTNKFAHIIKLHTKSISQPYLELTNFLLSKTMDVLCKNKINNCNCIGHPNYYVKLTDDEFNNELKFNYLSELNVSNSFVAGTIFYSPSHILDKTLEIIKKSHKKFLFNNLYENNSINFQNSPIHFLERLFGTIK